MIKLFASDMDGTLLSSDFTISRENLDAIAALNRHGIVFAIATGRSYVDAHAILCKHGLQCPVVCSNGAAVRNADGSLISKHTIPLDELNRLCAYLDEHGLFYGINSAWDLTLLHTWETTLDREETATAEKLTFVKEPILSQYGLRFTDSFAPFLRGDEDACSLSIASTNQKKLDHFAAFAAKSGATHFMPSGFSSMEVTPSGCSKAGGLKKLGDFLGISLAEMISMGDNYNDLDMLLETGRSYAVRTAPEDIRAACTGVAPGCNESGVAYIIDLLLKEG